MDMMQTWSDETNNGNKVKQGSSKPDKQTCQKATVWCCKKIHTCVDQDFKHNWILRSIWENFKGKKMGTVSAGSSPSQCISWAYILRRWVATLPPPSYNVEKLSRAQIRIPGLWKSLQATETGLEWESSVQLTFHSMDCRGTRPIGSQNYKNNK